MTTDQMIALQKSNMETLFGLAAKTFEGVEQLTELNVQAARALLGEAASASQAMLSIKDPQQFVALQASLLQPGTEKAVAYFRSGYEIVSGTAAEVNRITEATTADARAKFMAVVDNAAKNAPAGAENVVALFKSSTAAASNAFETAQQAAKQVAEVADANLQALSSSAVSAAQSAAKARRTAA
jgi:phasin family protein